MKKLFSSLKIGNMEIRNRIVLLSMHLGYAEGGFATEKLIRFYADRSRGGAGLIIIGGAHIHPSGSGGLHFMAIDDDKYLPDLKKLTDAVRAGGAKSAIQLFHSGRYAYSMLTGEQPVSASDIRSPLSGDIPRPLSVEEIKEMIGLFTRAAGRAKKVGFDAVEINGSTGYIVSQFLSPFTNHRTDEYGGSLENRMRFAAEIIQSIRKELGEDYPIIFRLSFDDFVDGGNGLAEARKIAVKLEKLGIDVLDMQAGWHEAKVPTSSMLVPRAAFAYLAREIKKEVNIPVIVTNRINDPHLAEDLLQDGTADLIGMARSLIADPEFPNKATNNRIEEIAPCIACNQGCMDGVFMGRPSTCLVNPAAGNEADLEIKPAEKSRKVTIVGAGPAGLMAARVLSMRGHEVTLYEKETKTGGQLNICGCAPDRSEFRNLLKFLIAEIQRLKINVITGVEVNAETLIENSPDVVILATGAKQVLPDMPGIDKPNVHTAESVLKGEAGVGNKVVIIGGGHVGCEVALLLAEKRSMSPEVRRFLVDYGALASDEAEKLTERTHSVTMVESRKKIAIYYGRTSRWAIMQGLHQKNVNMMANTKCVEILDGKVIVEKNGDKQELEADTIVVTSGYIKEDGLRKQLEGKVPELFVIGDAKKLLSCQNALFEAVKVGTEI